MYPDTKVLADTNDVIRKHVQERFFTVTVRNDLLAVLAHHLEEWTPRKWYYRILKGILLKQVLKELQE